MSVVALSWASVTILVASSCAWRMICALCWPSDDVRVASSTTGWAARSSASASSARNCCSRSSISSMLRDTAWR